MRRAVLLYAIVIGASIAAIAGILQLGDSGTVPGAGYRSSATQLRIGTVILACDPHHSAPGHRRCGASLRLACQACQPARRHRRNRRRAVARPVTTRTRLAGRFCVSVSQSSLNILQLMSQVGVILFMFTVGLT
jgi:hypothetical protein